MIGNKTIKITKAEFCALLGLDNMETEILYLGKDDDWRKLMSQRGRRFNDFKYMLTLET